MPSPAAVATLQDSGVALADLVALLLALAVLVDPLLDSAAPVDLHPDLVDQAAQADGAVLPQRRAA
jgi:hypothetical protein